MMLRDISVVFNSFADAFGLMSRKRSSDSRQVLVSFVKAPMTNTDQREVSENTLSTQPKAGTKSIRL
jgi:hypothetical protein